MGWFSREKTSLEKMADSFLDTFPAWAIQHSTELVVQLYDNAQGDAERIWKELLANTKNKVALIDYFTGAHGVFLAFSPEGQIMVQLVGRKTIEKCVASWPERVKDFFLLAGTYHQRSLESGKKDDLLSSLEKFYGIEIRPLDAHVGTVTVNSLQKSGEDIPLSPSLAVAGLLPTLNRLQEEQLTWLQSQVEAWSASVGKN